MHMCYIFHLDYVPSISKWLLCLIFLANEQDQLVSEESKSCLDASLLHVDLDSHEYVEDTNDLVGHCIFEYFFTMGNIDQRSCYFKGSICILPPFHSIVLS